MPSLASYVLASVLLSAAASKMVSGRGTQLTLRFLLNEPRWARKGFVALVAIEAVLAGLLVGFPTALPVLLSSLALMSMFAGTTTYLLLVGYDGSCGCFGDTRVDYRNGRRLSGRDVLRAYALLLVNLAMVLHVSLR